ncbi:hypothetical protein CONPUDRAFT_157945 [Coniophora puteana RWD-64-598 SS2]|uniref:Retrotransposon gag domain-containing protein n=1 Tax=Coniophora puteana (strain RWD-64-598) TaxID=741705 RepID=A0A5M3MCR9_CONPW|nr:uncharacterized protein CONPUDRAFT_157945 [Coniophora puteana RWD-64-598 SS2]EIW76787.1 hypothetical protein CONPUDRAFT_157945 [Coniophora puteana RWD-64-598 SS2]
MPPPTVPYNGFTLAQTQAIWGELDRMQTAHDADLQCAQQEIHDQQQQFNCMNQLANAQQTEITRLAGLLQNYQAIQHAAPGAAAIEKKIIGVKDPGEFHGEPGNFAPWRSRVRLWLHANNAALTTNFDCSSAILTRMKGRIPAKWARYHIGQFESGALPWPTPEDIMQQISDAFLPSTTKEWSRKKVVSLAMGNRRVEEWLTEFYILKEQGNMEDAHAIDLLIKNMSPVIRVEVFRGGHQHLPRFNNLFNKVKEIGVRVEEYDITMGKQRVNFELGLTSNGVTAGRGEPMEIGAAPQASSSQGPRGGCFTCQGPHFTRDCPQRKNGGGGGARGGESCPQGAAGHHTRALYNPETGRMEEQPQTAGAPQNWSPEYTPTPLKWQTATKDMDFEAARAYFRDYDFLNGQ